MATMAIAARGCVCWQSLCRHSIVCVCCVLLRYSRIGAIRKAIRREPVVLSSY